jgi:hypothetical protein
VAVGLLRSHTDLKKTHIFNHGLTERHSYRQCWVAFENTVHIVCHCPALICKGYSFWGDMFLRLKDLENVRVSSLISLAY